MKAMACSLFFSLAMLLASCSIGVIDGDPAVVLAPATLAGKTYRIKAKSGSGVFPSKGAFIIVFLSSEPWYTKQGDGVNTYDSWGTYSYSANGASGTVKADDSMAPGIVVSFTFNTANSGTLVAISMEDSNSTLTGTFTEL